ncbi:Hypothetical protein, putative [Bodo saltans]|uniref:Uncharacterized protein n=1 Tax=Bodo saltans TaxID=75058 RepID=A0A0S4JUZ7_BODSA|nr:Hypothetical protein, putative [Bodo saltans]|eukprot:CUG93215.1 Hypothetical protein, putative [Bodo saltans]
MSAVAAVVSCASSSPMRHRAAMLRWSRLSRVMITFVVHQ